MTEGAGPGPVDGTIPEVLARIEAGEVTVQEALDAETAKGDDARSTLVEKLDELIAAAAKGDPEPGFSERVLVGNVPVDGVFYGPDFGNADRVPVDVAARIRNPAAWAD